MTMRLSRRKITSYIAQQLVNGVEAEQLVLKLASFLVYNGRTNELGLIVRDIEYELSKRGVALARVTSAFDLTEATSDAVTKLIKDQTGAHQVYLHQFIDPDVLGGVRIDLPGLQLNSTIARRLTTLRTNYKK
ncbi:F0F1 ATP synthase subunit delta [Candidatus Saccharibacteria bacterium]|nr:F0F1 ATP synthase subunit delta [Candidatus Saccharibacteria bacterium]